MVAAFSLLLCCASLGYLPAPGSPLSRLIAPSPAHASRPLIALARPAAARGGVRRESPAARSLLQKLEALRTTRTAPVDPTALASLVRPLSDGLRGQMLLEVLSGLRQRGKWELALALAQLLEANAPTPRPSRSMTVKRALPRPLASSAAAQPAANGAAGNVITGDPAEDVSGLMSAEDSAALLARARAAAFGSDEDGDPFDYGDLDDDDGGNWDDEDEDVAGLPVETVHYNVLISTLSRPKRWRETLELLARMRQRNVPRDTVTYNSAISVMKSAGKWKLALKLLRKMRAEQIPPDTITFSAAVASCSRAGEWRTALRLIALMRQAGIPPNTITYSAAISACDKAGEWTRALQLLRRMQTEGVPPDLIIFNAAIGACARAGEWQRAVSLLNDGMAEAGIEPDTVSYNAVMTSYANAQPPRPDDAKQLLSLMVQRGIAPDRVTHNALLSALGRAGRWQEARDLLQQMIDGEIQHGLDSPIRPDTISYTAAISACARAAQPAAADELLGELRVSGLPLATLAFSKTIAAHAATGDAAGALDLLKQISDEGLRHNAVTINTAIRVATDAGEYSAAGVELLAILSDVRAAGTPPPANAETVALINEVLSGIGDANMAGRENFTEADVAHLRGLLGWVESAVIAAEARAAAAAKRALEDEKALAEAEAVEVVA